MTKTVQHIISAKVLALDMTRYHAYVSALENTPDFLSWRRQERIREQCFPVMADGCPENVLGRFDCAGFRFSSRRLAVTYEFAADTPITPAWHMARHVTQRNRTTWRLMELIAQRQSKWIRSGDLLDMESCSQSALLKDYRERWSNAYIDASIISRLVRGRDALCPQGCRLPLSDLLPGRSQWLGYRVGYIIENGGWKLDDGDIAALLSERFSVPVSRQRVGQVRGRLGIASLRKRLNGPPSPFRDAMFGGHRRFDVTLSPSLPSRSGVYEFSLRASLQPYPHGASRVVYIGATKSLKSRLSAYLQGNGHSRVLRDLISSDGLNVRWTHTPKPRVLEARLLHGFEAAYGALPFANKVKPKLA